MIALANNLDCGVFFDCYAGAAFPFAGSAGVPSLVADFVFWANSLLAAC